MSYLNRITAGISKGSQWAMDKVVSRLPDITVANPKILNGIKWAGKHISSPQNRLILGATALMSQPFIDLFNRRVDENTRKVSAARTVAKILAGTTSGFLVRYYSIKAVEKMTRIPSKNKKVWQTFFTPSPEFVKLTKRALLHYKNAIGTILALIVMIGTNFLFDAPVTQILTNSFIKSMGKNSKNNKDNKLPVRETTKIITYSPHTSPTNLIDKAIKGISENSKAEKGGIYG